MVGSIFAFQTFGQIDMLTQGGPLKTHERADVLHLHDAAAATNDGKAAVLAVALFVITFVLTLIQMRVLERRVHYGR